LGGGTFPLQMAPKLGVKILVRGGLEVGHTLDYL